MVVRLDKERFIFKHIEVEIIVTGENEQAVLDEFVKMFEDGFGE